MDYAYQPRNMEAASAAGVPARRGRPRKSALAGEAGPAPAPNEAAPRNVEVVESYFGADGRRAHRPQLRPPWQSGRRGLLQHRRQADPSQGTGRGAHPLALRRQRQQGRSRVFRPRRRPAVARKRRSAAKAGAGAGLTSPTDWRTRWFDGKICEGLVGWTTSAAFAPRRSPREGGGGEPRSNSRA